MQRYLAMDGQVGACPDDYPLFRAAQYCNCKPWELLEQSLYWKERALMFMTAEVWAQKIKAEHS